MYSAQVLDHFKTPRHSGDLENATAVVECSNPVCGDILQLAARVDGDRIAEVRFKARGCVTTIACGSFIAEHIAGKLKSEARGLTAAIISDSLGNLPPATHHAADLAAETLAALLARLD